MAKILPPPKELLPHNIGVLLTKHTNKIRVLLTKHAHNISVILTKQMRRSPTTMVMAASRVNSFSKGES